MATHSGNYYLNTEQMKDNARYIRDYLTPRGWSINAVCGMLGNMETESTINPGIWQNLDEGNTSLGYGLVQWTPATKYLNWCDDRGYNPSTLSTALKRIEYELDNDIQYIPTNTYPLTFSEFKTSTLAPDYLANVFLHNYERPAEPNQPARGMQANYWYTYLTDSNTPSGSVAGVYRKPKQMNLLFKYIGSRRFIK